MEIVDGGTSTFFLTTFGRATRTTVCSAKWLSSQTSHRRSICLMAIPSTISAVRAVSSGNCCKPGKPEDVIDELYIRCLARKPTETEKTKLMAFVGEEGRTDEEVLNDLFWAVLNSKEFIFNH